VGYGEQHLVNQVEGTLGNNHGHSW
jgi:hypothetical protein